MSYIHQKFMEQALKLNNIIIACMISLLLTSCSTIKEYPPKYSEPADSYITIAVKRNNTMGGMHTNYVFDEGPGLERNAIIAYRQYPFPEGPIPDDLLPQGINLLLIDPRIEKEGNAFMDDREGVYGYAVFKTKNIFSVGIPAYEKMLNLFTQHPNQQGSNNTDLIRIKMPFYSENLLSRIRYKVERRKPDEERYLWFQRVTVVGKVGSNKTIQWRRPAGEYLFSVVEINPMWGGYCIYSRTPILKGVPNSSHNFEYTYSTSFATLEIKEIP